MNNWDVRLPGAEMWGPYLEQSPVSPAAFAEDPWEALRSFLPKSLPSALHTAASGYAAVLTFLVLGAVIALLLGGHADGTLLDLVCAGGCGVLLWEKLVALSETLCTQIESWNRFLLGFLPVYAGVLTLGGESVAGASAGGFLLTLLCALAQGLTVLVPPLLQCYLALSMLHLCGNRAGELLQGGWQCAGKAAGVGGQTSGCPFGSGAHLNAAAGPCGPSHRAASDRDGADHRGDVARRLGDGAVVPSAFEKRAGAGCTADHCGGICTGLSGNACPAWPAFRMRTSMRNDGQ